MHASDFPDWFVAVPIALLVVAAGLAWFVRSQLAAIRQARSWPTANATILGSSISSQQIGEGEMYEPKVRYAYEVAGQRYESERIRFGRFWESQNGARAILERFPVGSSVPVYYDPADPAIATLETTAASKFRLYSLSFAVLALAGMAVFMVYRMWFWPV